MNRVDHHDTSNGIGINNSCQTHESGTNDSVADRGQEALFAKASEQILHTVKVARDTEEDETGSDLIRSENTKADGDLICNLICFHYCDFFLGMCIMRVVYIYDT